MSHHLDSPASRRGPRLNVTDVYVFDSDGATVLAMIVNTSLAGPHLIGLVRGGRHAAVTPDTGPTAPPVLEWPA